MKSLILLTVVVTLVLGVRGIARIERARTRKVALTGFVTVISIASLVVMYVLTRHLPARIGLSLTLFSLFVPAALWLAYFVFRKERQSTTA